MWLLLMYVLQTISLVSSPKKVSKCDFMVIVDKYIILFQSILLIVEESTENVSKCNTIVDSCVLFLYSCLSNLLLKFALQLHLKIVLFFCASQALTTNFTKMVRKVTSNSSIDFESTYLVFFILFWKNLLLPFLFDIICLKENVYL